MATTAYFGNEIKTALVAALQTAQKELHIAVFTFNNPELLDVLRDCCARGVKISLLVNSHEDSKNNLDYSELLNSYDTDIFDLYQVPSSERTIHHKFCVIDGTHFFIGLANWTKAAFGSNDENALYISDAADLCSQYIAEFERICAPIRDKAKEAALQVEQKGAEIIQAVQDYTKFAADYFRKHKTAPPAHLLPAHSQQYASLLPTLPASSIQPAPVADVIDENVWRRAVLEYDEFQNPKYGFILVACKIDDKTKWGVINMQGEELIPCVYDEIWNDEFGLFPVRIKDKEGFATAYPVDGNYEIVIPFYSACYWFNEGLACVELNGKYGFINTKGQTVIDYKFDNWGNFQKSKKNPSQIFAIMNPNSGRADCFIINSKGEQVGKTYFKGECQRRINQLDFE